jgi:hypothetical protein
MLEQRQKSPWQFHAAGRIRVHEPSSSLRCCMSFIECDANDYKRDGRRVSAAGF